MIENEVVLCLSTMSWDFLWLRNQELMSRFAAAGNRVLFVEPIGIRMPMWEDRHRIVSRLRNRRRAGNKGIRPIQKNLWAVDPIVNPLQQLGFIHRRNVDALTAQLKKGLGEIGGDKPIIWTYVPTPLARDVIANIPHKALVYDCIDALTENPKGVFSFYAESEKKLSSEADLVLASSPNLYERQRPLNPNTHYLPHGVQYAKFALDHAAEPALLAEIPHPRLTFFGGLDERINLELLARLAERHAEWQVVLMGVVRTDISRLRKLSNIHFLGHIPHDELPAFLFHSDVMLLPYVIDAYSRYINPAKLFECLAVGKPMVATSLPIFEEYLDVVDVAASDDEFEKLVERAVREGKDAGRIKARRECAQANTWEKRFDEINALVEGVLRRV